MKTGTSFSYKPRTPFHQTQINNIEQSKNKGGGNRLNLNSHPIVAKSN